MKTVAKLRLYDLNNMKESMTGCVEAVNNAIANVENEAELLHILETLMWDLREEAHFVKGMVENLKGEDD